VSEIFDFDSTPTPESLTAAPIPDLVLAIMLNYKSFLKPERNCKALKNRCFIKGMKHKLNSVSDSGYFLKILTQNLLRFQEKNARLRIRLHSSSVLVVDYC